MYKLNTSFSTLMYIVSICAKMLKVEVDLMTAEQKTEEFLAINPNGKVPALRIQNVEVRYLTLQKYCIPFYYYFREKLGILVIC